MNNGDSIFARLGWLALQPAPFREEVLRRARPRSLAAGETVYAEGDPPGGLYGIASGSIAGYARHGDGPLHRLEILPRGQWFGSGPMLTGRPRTLTFDAHEPSLLMHFPLSMLEAMEQLDRSATRRFALVSEMGTGRLARIACDLAIPDSSRRIAAVLLRVTGAEEGLGGFYPEGFPITQSALGEMANASRNLVNRVLGTLAARGWIEVGYNRVAVKDLKALIGFINADG